MHFSSARDSIVRVCVWGVRAGEESVTKLREEENARCTSRDNDS